MAKKQIYLTSFSLNTPKTLITGTDGFIGFHLANALLAKSHTIVGLDNINDYYDVQLKYDRLSQAGIHFSQAGINLSRAETHLNQAGTHPDPDNSDQPTTPQPRPVLMGNPHSPHPMRTNNQLTNNRSGEATTNRRRTAPTNQQPSARSADQPEWRSHD